EDPSRRVPAARARGDVPVLARKALRLHVEEPLGEAPASREVGEGGVAHAGRSSGSGRGSRPATRVFRRRTTQCAGGVEGGSEPSSEESPTGEGSYSVERGPRPPKVHDPCRRDDPPPRERRQAHANE